VVLVVVVMVVVAATASAFELKTLNERGDSEQEVQRKGQQSDHHNFAVWWKKCNLQIG
jgi:hypothetical protein